mgnify:FL=1
MPELNLDETGLPEPQYKSEDGTRYEAQRGKEGASFSYTKDGHNEALGSKNDPEAPGNGSLIGITKAIRSVLNAISTTASGIKAAIEALPGRGDTVDVRVTNPVDEVTVLNPVETVTVANPVTSVTVGNMQYSSGAKHAQIELPAATATELTAGATGRTVIDIRNIGTADVFIGFDNTVTDASGYPIAAGASKQMVVASGVKVFAYSVEAGSVSILEG